MDYYKVLFDLAKQHITRGVYVISISRWPLSRASSVLPCTCSVKASARARKGVVCVAQVTPTGDSDSCNGFATGQAL